MDSLPHLRAGQGPASAMMKRFSDSSEKDGTTSPTSEHMPTSPLGSIPYSKVLESIPNPATKLTVPKGSPPSRAMLYMLVLFVLAGAFMTAHHFFYAFLNGRPASNYSLLATLKLPFTITNQSLVNAISNAISLVVQNALAGVIGCAFAQTFWWRMPTADQARFRKLTDPALDFNDNPLNVKSWSSLFNTPLLAAISICGALLTGTSVAGPGSLTVTSNAFGERCVVATANLTYANLTDLNPIGLEAQVAPGSAGNASTTYTYDGPNGRALSLVTRVLMAGSYFAPPSPCGTCQYNISFVAPAVQCTNITQATDFGEWLPTSAADINTDNGGIVGSQSEWTYVWNATYNGTLGLLQIASRNELRHPNSSANDESFGIGAYSLLPQDAQPVVALQCAGYAATYNVSIDQNATTTMGAWSVDIGAQLLYDASSGLDADDVDADGDQLNMLALWEALASQLAGAVQYLPAQDAFTQGSSWVAWSAVSASGGDTSASAEGEGAGVGAAWQWAGYLQTIIPEIMQNVSLSLVAWQQAQAQMTAQPANAVHTPTDTTPSPTSAANATSPTQTTTCRVPRLRYTYDRKRLLGTYGATMGLAALCMVCGALGAGRMGRSESLDFGRIAEWAKEGGEGAQLANERGRGVPGGEAGAV